MGVWRGGNVGHLILGNGYVAVKRAYIYPEDVGVWRQEQLLQGLIEIPVDGEIGIRANTLADFHADPADRIIVATALEGHELITADERILDWPGQLSRLDARR